jgi:hypothetical protein
MRTPNVESARVENDQGRAFMLRYRYQLAYLLPHDAAALQDYVSNFFHSSIASSLYAETDWIIHTSPADFNHRCPPLRSTALTRSG